MAFELPIRRGEDHPNARLSNAERRECRQAYRMGEKSISDLAREHRTAKSNMHRIVHQPLDYPEDS